jgi:hypothetical protein
VATAEGVEFDRVYGPYKKKSGSGIRWQIMLKLGGDLVKSIYRSVEQEARAKADELRALAGGPVKPPRGMHAKKPGAAEVKVPQADYSDDAGHINFEAEIQALALSLRGATKTEQIDVVKRKCDALKALKALQLTATDPDERNPALKMNQAQLLEAAAQHLRENGYKVTGGISGKKKAAKGDKGRSKKDRQHRKKPAG